MSEQGRRDELDDLASGEHPVSRRYRQLIEREGPSEALDATIMDRARRALEQDQRTRRRRFAVPLALAATVVLSFGVFLAVRQQQSGPLSATIHEQQRPAEQDMVARPPPLQAQQLPAPAAPPSAAEAAATRGAVAAAVAPVPRAPEPIAQQKAEQPMAEREMAAPAADRNAPAAMNAAPAMAVEPARSEPKLAKKRSAMRDSRKAAPAPALERIRALRAKGDIDEARRELEKFRMMHPDDEVPDDLRPLLRPVTPPTP